MRFALLGTDPDGLAMACALVESGRHSCVAYTSADGLEDATRRRLGASARLVPDLEEVLANPEIEAIVVAGTPANRPAQLRRALQSERHVLCVHPADGAPDLAYEAALLQGDSHCVLMALLTESLHPAVQRLATLTRSGAAPLAAPRLIQVERWTTDAILLDTSKENRPAFPGWDLLRTLGGEVAEVSALTRREELELEEPVLLTGRFESGLLFEVSLIPHQEQERLRVTIVGSQGSVDLSFPDGREGVSFLSWESPEGGYQEETWEPWSPWLSLVEIFEMSLKQAGQPATPRKPPVADPWQAEVRCLELDDAARRSATRRRSSLMEYQEASEEVGFKGTMTLVGCGLLWLLILLVILANWWPKIAWIAVPLLVLFLALQLLKWFLPRGSAPAPGRTRPGPSVALRESTDESRSER